MAWCDDNPRDRAKGDRAERQAFSYIIAEGLKARRHPYGQSSHDIVVYYEGREHPVEVREKYATWQGRYGLEHPKPEQWTQADVIYLIKDTRLLEWRWARMRELPEPQQGIGDTYYGGRVLRNHPHDYWPSYCWTPLSWDYAA